MTKSLADRLLEEAFAIYGLETVSESMLAPAMVQIGDMWHEGRASTATEHFASNYLRRKIDSIINAAPQATTGPLVILGCAPGDWHELGLLLIYLMLRRRSVNTIYLGQNVPDGPVCRRDGTAATGHGHHVGHDRRHGAGIDRDWRGGAGHAGTASALRIRRTRLQRPTRSFELGCRGCFWARARVLR